MGRTWFVACAVTLLAVGAAHGQRLDDAGFLSAIGELREASYSDKVGIAQRILQSGHPRVRAVLTALLEDRLVFRNDDNRAFLLKSAEGDPVTLIDPVTLKESGSVAADSVSKVGTNNSLRRTLRVELARFSLSSTDAATRIQAVREVSQSLDENTLALLKDRYAVETNAAVRKELAVGLALGALDGEDAGARLKAVQTLKGSLSQDVRNRLARVVEEDQDPKVKAAAKAAVASIDGPRGFYSGIETLFFGLSLGSVLVLIAIGLEITFGVIGVINMAHGELMMIGAYATFLTQQTFSSWMPHAQNWYFVAAIPISFAVAAMVGMLIEAAIIRHLYGRPLDTLLATLGVSFILIQVIRLIFGDNRAVNSPTWLQGSWEIAQDIRLPFNRLFIIGFCVLCIWLMYFIVGKTKLGLLIRATTQNRTMASSLGVNTRMIDMLTFGLGSGLAGMAGCALTQIGCVTPDMGQNYIIDSFLVVVVGGVGKLAGAIWSAAGMGTANKLLEPASGAVWAKVLILLLVIAFIQRKPSGLFPAKGRLADV